LSELNLTTDLADAYIASATTWNAKQDAITLTTTGNNGASTFVSNTLNIPTYTLAGLGGINLTSLSATSPLLYDNTTGVFSIQQSSGSQAGFLSAADWTTFNNKVPSTRTLSINGTAYDLSADRSWTITPNVNATNTQDYTATAGQTTFSVSGGYTIGQLAVFYNGSKLAAAEYTATDGSTFVLATACQANDIVQAVVSVTGGGIGGSGTTNYISKWTASGVLGNSVILESTSSIGIGTTPPTTTNFSHLFVGKNISMFSGSSTDIYIGSNFYYDGGFKQRYAEASAMINTNAGDFIFQNSSSGTAGGAFNGVERMRITNTGRVGIGTNSPVAGILQVNAASNSQIAIVNTSVGTSWLGINSQDMVMAVESGGGLIFKTGSTYPTGISTGTERLRITSGGVVGIGGTAGAGRLQVWGENSSSANFAIYVYNSGGFGLFGVRNDGYLQSPTTYNNTTASGANVSISSSGYFERSTSSIKYKKDVKDYDKGLAEVMAMRPVYYKGKGENDGDKQFAGLIAEEIDALGLNEFVQYADDQTPDALYYANMIALMTKAIQELKAEVDTLKQLVK
jgi:hypothetical protein